MLDVSYMALNGSDMPRHRPNSDHSNSDKTPDERIAAPRKTRGASNQTKSLKQAKSARSVNARASKNAPSQSALSQKASLRIAARRERVAKRFSMAGPTRVVAACAALVVSGLLLAVISSNHAQFRTHQAQADGHAQQLYALQTQHNDMKRRLAFLQLPKGREQVLLKNGYLRPGDRVLLFPDEADSIRAAKTQSSTRNPQSAPVATTDSNPQNAVVENRDNTPSTLSRWWNDARRASGSQSANAAQPTNNADGN